LPILLGGELLCNPRPSDASGLEAIVHWGNAKGVSKARAFADRHRLPCIRLEEGFIRSTAPGFDQPAWSIIKDDLGIFHDAHKVSRLERMIPNPLNTEQYQRSQALIRLCRKQAFVTNDRLFRNSDIPDQPFILVVDQHREDVSVAGGLASANSFSAMLEAALSEHDNKLVLLQMHHKGHFDPGHLRQHPRIRIYSAPTLPPALSGAASAVYCVTSRTGFDALLQGTPVHCFGMPFYAGWGLTQDALPPPARRCKVSLEQLVHSALVEYMVCVHPQSSQPCTPEALMGVTGLQRRVQGLLGGHFHAVGFSRWKRPILASFLQHSRITHCSTATFLPESAPVIVWGRQPVDGGQRPPIRVEDGFIRSVGLGADLVRPISWVMDPVGIYFDATQPSRLENLLNQQVLNEAGLQRARRLIDRLIRTGLTKYNVGNTIWQRPTGQSRVILVPGQVESDASIRYGCPGIRTNMALLSAVRKSAPNAWIVYKPHPDVQAGLRASSSAELLARSLVNDIVTDCPIHLMFDQVDELHVLTSLAGFEGLVRNIPVHVYGQPFYAGWGLTHDHCEQPHRRQNQLSIESLVHAALIDYPIYVSRHTGLYITPEEAIDELLEWQTQGVERSRMWRLIKYLKIRMNLSH
jgi:capsular polysaccharide export protein